MFVSKDPQSIYIYILIYLHYLLGTMVKSAHAICVCQLNARIVIDRVDGVRSCHLNPLVPLTLVLRNASNISNGIPT